MKKCLKKNYMMSKEELYDVLVEAYYKAKDVIVLLQEQLATPVDTTELDTLRTAVTTAENRIQAALRALKD